MSNKKLYTNLAEIGTDDLLFEILLRLPSCSICRFKSICKKWHSLITSSGFRRLWRERQNIKPPTGLFLQYTDKFISFSSEKSITIPSSSFQTRFNIEQSCNGLLLCTDITGMIYYVYNPTTNTLVTLPNVPNKQGFNKKLCTMSLAFDPNVSSIYKVISRIGLWWMNIYHIYSSHTRCWELKNESEFQCTQSDFKGEGIYWNGSINWIHALLCFDIENHTSKAMPRPPPAPAHHVPERVTFFGESCGRLNYTRLHWSSPCTIDVYELKRDYSRWTLKYNVILKKCRYYTTEVLSVVHGAEEEDSFLVLKLGKKIVRYNLVSKTSEELTKSPGSFLFSAFQHFEYPFSI